MKDNFFNASTLLYLRQTANLTQAELASKLDSCNDVVSRWELSVHQPNQTSVNKLAEVFGIDPDDFYLSSHEFSKKHNVLHPAWTASLFNKVIMRIHKILDHEDTDIDVVCKTGATAANMISKMRDKLDLVELMHSTPSKAQLRDMEAVANAVKHDDDLIKDPDADPRA